MLFPALYTTPPCHRACSGVALTLLNAAAFFFLTTHGESLQLSYLMPFITENAKEAVGEVVGFIPPHVTLNSAALWVACKRPEETSALSHREEE